MRTSQATLDRLSDRVTSLTHRVEARKAIEASQDRSRYDWYGDSCPCGLEVGTCPRHPRARQAQRPPEGEWSTYLATCGRGWGKNARRRRVGSMDDRTGQSKRLAIVGSTAADCRDVLIEGESGLLAVCPPWFYPRYESSKRRLTFPNGGIITSYSAEEPDRLRSAARRGTLR